MAYVAPTVRSIGDATTAADYNIIANSVIDLNLARVPVAALSAYAGATAPTGWLLCDGSAVSQTTYAALYAIIGASYDATAPGAGNFRVPDLRARVPAGLDNMGGTDAGRLSWQNTIGTVGTASILTDTGTQTHTLTTSEMPSHTHTSDINARWGGSLGLQDNNDAVARMYNGSLGAMTTTSAPRATGSAGSSGSHNNMQPTMLLNYIIKT